MEIAISIGTNVILGLVLIALLYWKLGADTVRAATAEEALGIFRRFFPDTAGVATLADDGRSALIALDGGGIALLLRYGRRWNARVLRSTELSKVSVDPTGLIELAFADFGWPRARIAMADESRRAAWVARLESLADAPEHAHA